MEDVRRRPPIVVLVLSSALAACGGTTATERPSSPAGSPIVATAAPSPSASPDPVEKDRPAGVDALSHERYLPMWNEPGRGGADFVFDARSPTGEGIAPMLVAARRTIHDQRWVEVLLPIRPNGASAWARADDVDLVRREEEIVVDLSQRTLRYYVRDRLAERFRVGVGAPATPTGTGTFYVWQRVPFEDPNQPYGIFALGLSGFSPVLSDWPGGGRMAIHGTPYASDRGQTVSHGCVRVYNEDMKHLTDVRFGTPVIIRR
jgi:lipoprotein-anchoring transpeptidase ErfK/SrfK